MSETPSSPSTGLSDVQRGLRMAHPPDPAALAAEKTRLRDLQQAPAKARLFAYLRLVGPGYLQSAMTLGGGTAVSALLAGALFGYALLWVAPVAMVLGLIMLSAVAYQTLSTGERPLTAMRRHAGPFFAWGWALGALVASIIWHFPQYSLAAACIVDVGDAIAEEYPRTAWLLDGLRPQVMGFVVLGWALLVSMMYGTSPRLVRMYERLLKYMVWAIVGCFAWVVVATGIDDWGALLRGFFVPGIPADRNGVAGTTLVLSGLAAAVGVNMVFLYPYSLLARGWGREHRGLAGFDLLTGMLLPYLLASSLITIAAANTIHLDPTFDAPRIAPLDAAESLSGVVGPGVGRVVFGLGVLGMALSTITLHMLCAGFVCAEAFGWPVGSLRYKLATLLPVPGVFGPVLWSKFAVWLAVPTSILCGFLLPVAYIGFILLQRNRRYLKDDTPTGPRGNAWLGAMVFTTLFLTVFLAWYAFTKGPGYFRGVLGSNQQAAGLVAPAPAGARPEPGA
ncbi:MAG: divalent metal cation transporter [Planctomycetota bacterium]|jgi:Mn2+/Fe2+ NRAMP family transporter